MIRPDEIEYGTEPAEDYPDPNLQEVLEAVDGRLRQPWSPSETQKGRMMFANSIRLGKPPYSLADGQRLKGIIAEAARDAGWDVEADEITCLLTFRLPRPPSPLCVAEIVATPPFGGPCGEPEESLRHRVDGGSAVYHEFKPGE